MSKGSPSVLLLHGNKNKSRFQKVAKTWEQLKCPAVEGWIKMWDMCTMKYYAAIREDEILPFVTTQIGLGNTMLKEISQAEIAKNHMNSLIYKI